MAALTWPTLPRLFCLWNDLGRQSLGDSHVQSRVKMSFLLPIQLSFVFFSHVQAKAKYLVHFVCIIPF